jgi:hypothetical protein
MPAERPTISAEVIIKDDQGQNPSTKSTKRTKCTKWEVLFVPIGCVEGSFLIQTLICVRAEEVALGLDEIGGEAVGGVGL